MDNQLNRRTFIKLTAATITTGLSYQSATAGTCAQPYGQGVYGVGSYSAVTCVPTSITMLNKKAGHPPQFWLHTVTVVIAAVATFMLHHEKANHSANKISC